MKSIKGCRLTSKPFTDATEIKRPSNRRHEPRADRILLAGPRLILLVLPSVFLVGCGEEDFSQPPSAIAERLAKAKANTTTDPPKQPEAKKATTGGDKNTDALNKDTAPDTDIATLTGTDPTNGTRPINGHVPVGVSGQNKADDGPQPTLNSAGTTAATKGVESQNKDRSTDQKIVEGPSENSDQTKPKLADPSVGMLTAGGRTKQEIDQQKSEDTSVLGAGASLLDKLKVTPKKPQEKNTAQNRDAKRQSTRFGRFAITNQAWLELQNQLAKRSYIAITKNGSRLAASSGRRSLEYLSTQIEYDTEELLFNQNSNDASAQRRVQDRRRSRRTKPKTVSQPVRLATGLVRSIELTDNDDLVLIGTEDGRLVVRSCATPEGRDIYAQDLMSFQDQHRPATKLADVAITAIRIINHDSILTVNSNYECHVWKRSDIVHSAMSPEELSEAVVQLPQAPVLTATPKFQVMTPATNVLSLTLSADSKLAAIITSDEKVTIFNTQDGQIVNTLTAADLDDTQPVTALIEKDKDSVLMGLADGRLMRRSLSSEKQIQSVNEKGVTVDYEILFAPDLGDRSGAITCLRPKWNQQLLYIGRSNGSVSTFDLSRKQMLRTSPSHRGPVMEIRSTIAGVVTVGSDRTAKLSDRPQTAKSAGLQTKSFQLPRDERLKTELIIADDSLEENQVTQARRIHSENLPTIDAEVSGTELRLIDPILTLHQHRLRTAATVTSREAARSAIKKIQPTSATLVQPVDTDPKATIPELSSQISTQLDFAAKPLRRVIMGIDDEGRTIAAGQFRRQKSVRTQKPDQSIFVWDTKTKTPLRTWNQMPGMLGLDISANRDQIFPTPPSATLNLLDGRLQINPSQDYSTWCLSRDSGQMISGIIGQSAVSQPTIQSTDLSSGKTSESLEIFEGYVSAMALSQDGSNLFVNLRERNRIRLLQLDAKTLAVTNEISSEPITGSWDPETAMDPKTVVGATAILASADNDHLVTYGQHPEGWQFRIWRQKRNAWPADQLTVIPSNKPMVESEMTGTPFAFVSNESRQLAVVTLNGFTTIGLRKGKVEQTIPLPNIDGHRPVTLLTADGELAIAGDQDGKIYLWKLKSLAAKPRFFTAHSGPIVGLACSSNGRFLATAGEENRINVWDLNTIDPSRYKGSKEEVSE